MRLVISAMAAFTFISCTSVQVPKPDAVSVLRSEADRLLKHAKEAPDGDYLLVVDAPAEFSLDRAERSSAEQMGIPHELLQKLLAQRSRQAVWRGDGLAFRSISKREIDDVFRREPDWPQFYARYPGSRGFVEFAGPVFTSDRSEALLYQSYSCHGDCGWGSLVHYKRTAAGWVKASEWLHWFS